MTFSEGNLYRLKKNGFASSEMQNVAKEVRNPSLKVRNAPKDVRSPSSDVKITAKVI